MAAAWLCELHGAGELGGPGFDQFRRWREAIGQQIGGAVFHHGDAPAEEVRERGDRARIGPAAQQQQMRWRGDCGDEQLDARWWNRQRGVNEGRAQRISGVRARDDECHALLAGGAMVFGHAGERLPLLGRRYPGKQHVHGALTTGAEPEQLVRGAAHVVTHDARLAAGRHLARVFAQVTFETTAGQESGIFAVGGDEHLRTGFGIGGTAGPDDRGEYQGFIGKQVRGRRAGGGGAASCGVQIYASLSGFGLRVDGSNQ